MVKPAEKCILCTLWLQFELLFFCFLAPPDDLLFLDHYLVPGVCKQSLSVDDRGSGQKVWARILLEDWVLKVLRRWVCPKEKERTGPLTARLLRFMLGSRDLWA